MDNNSREWWKEYFAKEFLLIEGMPSKEINVKSVDFIEHGFNLPKGSRVLDLACGYGRISIELAKRGYAVVGLDYCKELLDIARQLSDKEGVKVEFVQGDMREMAYSNEFDGIVCWSNSFGYFPDEENEKVMRLIACSLKKKGKLIPDLHHRDAYIRKYLGRSWREQGDFFILSQWTFDVHLSRLNIEYTLVNLRTGEVKKTLNSFREYTLTEIKHMLKDAGLEFLKVYGDLTPHFNLNTDSMTVLAQKI